MTLTIDCKNLTKSVTTWLVILSCFGYPLTLSIGLLLNLNIGIYNVTIRLLIAFLQLSILIYNIYTSKIKFDVISFIFLTFWILYSIRLIYDLEIKGIRYLGESSAFIYMFAFGGVCLPSLMVLSISNFETYQVITKKIFILLITSNILMLGVLAADSNRIFDLILTRSEIFTENSGGRIRVLNGISYSMQGSYLLVAYIARLLFSNKEQNNFLSFIVVMLSLINIIIGASRGPIITTFLTIFLLLFFFTKTQGLKVIKPIIIIILIIVSLVFLISNFIDLREISIVGRFITTYDYGGNHKFEYRNDEWESAIIQFLNNPIIGDQFVVKFDNAYPHNLFLEVAMALGVVGLFIIICYFFYLLYVIYKSICYEAQFFEMLSLLVIIILSFQLSGSLFTGITFWVFTLYFIKTNIYFRFRGFNSQ